MNTGNSLSQKTVREATASIQLLINSRGQGLALFVLVLVENWRDRLDTQVPGARLFVQPLASLQLTWAESPVYSTVNLQPSNAVNRFWSHFLRR